MSVIALNQTVDRVYLALEDPGTGEQVMVRTPSEDRNVWTEVYRSHPNGKAINVQSVPWRPGFMIIYGHFNTDLQILFYAEADNSTLDISPPGLGETIVNTLNINPGKLGEIVCTVSDGRVYWTPDSGASGWNLLDNAPTDAPTALRNIWGGFYWPNEIFYASKGTNQQLYYSPNFLANKLDVAGSQIQPVANIADIDL